MSSFKDGLGRDWTVSITLGTVKRVRDATGHNLALVLDDKMAGIATLTSDLMEFVNVLWHIVEPQAVAKGVTQEQFLEGILGDSIDAALNAFVDSLADFFPPRQRKILSMTWAKVQATSTTMADNAVAEIEAMDLSKEMDSRNA